MKPPLSWIELDTRALAQNVTFLRSLNAGNSEPRTPYFCAAVKANAYGHGLSEIVAELAELPVEYIAVHSVSEAALALQAGWSNRILCVGYIQLSDTSE
ncbi:MAG: alanine racemase, partial [Candidatus Zixiibacteriota bacterium]